MPRLIKKFCLLNHLIIRGLVIRLNIHIQRKWEIRFKLVNGKWRIQRTRSTTKMVWMNKIGISDQWWNMRAAHAGGWAYDSKRDRLSGRKRTPGSSRDGGPQWYEQRQLTICRAQGGAWVDTRRSWCPKIHNHSYYRIALAREPLFSVLKKHGLIAPPYFWIN